MKKLFQSIDSSGDGNINLEESFPLQGRDRGFQAALSFEEFEKLVQSPKLRFWMAQLEWLGLHRAGLRHQGGLRF